MDEELTFGQWLRRNRKARDLTQTLLARHVSCALGTIRKLEADELRPSKELAAHLAAQLGVPEHELDAFVAYARGQADTPLPPADDNATGIATPMPRAVRPHNLPVPLTSFVGREKEIADIKQLLANQRLTTLTGPGGTGKTRLALHVAAEVLETFPEGMWLVELARLADPALVPQAIAAVLGVREEPHRPLLMTLNAFLREKQLLLLLDNCEHLIEACAHAAETLLQACPQLHILATSREPLGIAGETSIRVPPLAVPDPHEQLPPDQLLRSEAVQLFVERALNVQPTFMLTLENAPAVVRVCHRLDGVPLAIELAAARVRMLTVEQIVARLNDRFRLLTGGSRTALPRQQTLQATIDWSYDMLTEDERALLCWLSVFVGGWTLEAVEAVCAGEGTGDVLEPLTRLVDKSLVQVEQRGDAVRYTLLETIRQYTLEKLAASGQADRMRRRHATYFLALGEAAPEWNGPHRIKWLERLEAEQDNLRAALRWAVEQPVGDIAVRLAGALGWFWYRQGDWNEGRTWLQRVLSRGGAADRSAAQAWLLFMQGILSSLHGDLAGGQAVIEESLALFQDLRDMYGSVTAQFNMAIAALEQGDAARAIALFEEQLNSAREQGNAEDVAWAQIGLGEVAVLREDVVAATELLDPPLAWFRKQGMSLGVAWALNSLGHVAQIERDYERAAMLHRESLPLFWGADQQRSGWALESLGEAALAQGDAIAATMYFTESLHICQRWSSPPIAWCLAGLGSAAALDEEPERAARLWGAAERLRQDIGCRPAPGARTTYERALATARVQIGESAFVAAWAEGRAMTLEQAIAEALTPI